MKLELLKEEKKELSEKRTQARAKIYAADGLNAKIITNLGIVTGHLLDIDNSGLAIALYDEKNWSKVNLDEEIEVEISFLEQKKSFPIRSVIQNISFHSNHKGSYCRVGLKILGTTFSALAKKRMMGFFSYPCPEFFRPIAYCSNPVFFDEIIHFQVLGLSTNGLTVITSLRNKGFFPGLCFKLNITIPLKSEFSVSVRVLESNLNFEKAVKLELCLVDKNPHFLAAVGEFILSFNKEVSPRILKDQGFFLDSIFNALQVSYMSCDEEWNEILKLRLNSYHSVGKLLDKKTAEDMIETFDHHSRHVVGKMSGRVVGAGRVVFVGKDIRKSEHAALKIPLPPKAIKEGFIEISRVCVHPDFRGSDFFISMIRHTSKIAIMSGAKYGVANCNSDLWEIYRKIGFKQYGKCFRAFGRDDCRLIYVKVNDVLEGNAGRVTVWNYIFHPLSEFILGTDTNFFNLIRRKIRRIINRYLIKKKLNTNFKKHISKFRK